MLLGTSKLISVGPRISQVDDVDIQVLEYVFGDSTRSFLESAHFRNVLGESDDPP